MSYLNVAPGLGSVAPRRRYRRGAMPIMVPGVRMSGMGGLGFCANPNDTACVMAEFEASVARNAATATANNRIYRANCSKDPFRTPDDCLRQYPDVSPADLWAGNQPGGGGPMPYAPTTGYITQTPSTTPPVFTPNVYTPPASTNNPPVAVATATLANASRPGQGYRVGDSWQLVVTGAPNAAVSADSSQNGKPNAAAAFGTTDASGRKVLTGTFDAGTVGRWVENWKVGGAVANPLSFDVADASTATPPPGGSVTPPAGSPAPGGGSPGSTSGSSSVHVLGYDVPLWMLLVGGLGGAWLFTRR